MTTGLESAKPKRSQGELARRLARQKGMCPGCGKYMAIATLQYVHVCTGAAREPNEEFIQRRLEKAKDRAIDAFRHRHGTTRAEETGLESSDGCGGV